MYPYITILSHKIYFHWIGILLATLVFIYWVYRYSKKNNLKFPVFFNYIVLFIILSYLLWRYFYNIIEYHLIIPTDIESLLSSYWYRFSFIWVSLGFLISLIIFLSNFKYSQERKKWFDVIFYSITLSFIVLWPFLLLWDVFFWEPTKSFLWVHAITTNTKIPYSTQNFWPVGIFISFLWLIFYILLKILHLIFKKHGIGIILFPFIWIGFIFIFHFQYYPKHFLFWVDIKVLYCILVSVIWTMFFYWFLNYKKW